jgi:hypothetical protein
MKAAMALLVEKQDPSFKITLILIGVVILDTMSLPLSYVQRLATASPSRAKLTNTS